VYVPAKTNVLPERGGNQPSTIPILAIGVALNGKRKKDAAVWSGSNQVPVS
jgi:hypothetical protein